MYCKKAIEYGERKKRMFNIIENYFKKKNRQQAEPAAEQSIIRGGGGAKFEIKRKSHCLQKSKLVDWGGQAYRMERAGLPAPPLAPGTKRWKVL